MPENNFSEYTLNTYSKDKWRKVGLNKRAGVVAPLFSVYSQKSLGIGDFNDIKLLIDFCVKSGISIVQLLPLNELGAGFCPYDSVSSFALEPAYISFELLSSAEKTIIRKELEEIRLLFSGGKPHIDYRIKQEKLHLLSDIFLKKENIDFAEFSKFKQKNAYWLDDFTLFKALKDYHLGLPWYEWQEEYKRHNKISLDAFRKDHEEEIDFYAWVQWLLFKQFLQIKEYAVKNKILIKGDLPFLVSRDSSDVWANPEFFKLDFAAGAPVDMYCAKGQRWGMPTYNWEVIEANGYEYLKERLSYAGNFYDILRIDHVVGLFRIWSISYNEPFENQGLNGFFDPPEVIKWLSHGKKILSVMLDSSDMLLCAEDLGVIPKVCPDTLQELGIPGNDVQRWAKDWSKKHDFLGIQDTRSLAVTMLSTHDTTNWSAWWKYEAGTIDEALFIRKCNDRLIDYTIVRDRLFDLDLSFHGRLRWLNNVDTAAKLVSILGRHREDVADFIDLYLNSFQEKEKLWKLLGMPLAMQEEASPELIERMLKFNLNSNAIFSIQLITDWLALDGFFKNDSYFYRINLPGLISEKNWSMIIPVSLDDLLKNRICSKIKKMVVNSGRI